MLLKGLAHETEVHISKCRRANNVYFILIRDTGKNELIESSAHFRSGLREECVW